MRGQRVTRTIIFLHRWMGFFGSILLGMWFLSGFVMMYTDFPGFGAEQRRQYAQPLDTTTVRLPPAHTFLSLRLSRLLDRPVWIGETKTGEIETRYADDGAPVPPIDSATANRIAMAFFNGKNRPLLVERITELDQWIPRAFYLVHMPVYRIQMNDPAHTWLYISSKSGEIIQRHTRRERILAWLGPIPHWIYPRDLIVRRPVWRQVVIWSSFLGALLCLSGIIAGFIRLRRSKRRSGYTSPYKKRWMKLHHYTGLFFGSITFTWVFSGLLSMNPLYLSPSLSLTESELSTWQGSAFDPGKFTLPPRISPGIVEIRPIFLQGQPYYIAYDNKGNSFITRGDSGKDTRFRSHEDTRFRNFDKSILIKALQQQQPAATITEATLIDNEDNYYYSKDHTAKLPIWQVKFNDPRRTWYYVDPSTGDVLYKYDKTSRLNRWLYHGLHSIDFSPLIRQRPLWDIVVIILLLGGAAVSITGIVLTVKRIKRRKKNN
jgi:uncharacterized iron-regulated membrane protein